LNIALMSDPPDLPPHTPGTRAALSALLGRAAPQVMQSLALEAALSTTTTEAVAASTIEEYVTWLGTFVPYAVAAVAADDEARARVLASMRSVVPPTSVPSVPVLARVGLLAIGLRLAREELRAATKRAPEAAALLLEFDVFAEVLRAALAPLMSLG
jgi:hypothetical protein